MTKYNFTSISEILNVIKAKNYDRNLASLIAMAYFFGEDENINFNFKNSVDLGFSFQFFNTDQYELTDAEFKEVVDSLLALKSENDVLEIRKILYKKQLNLLEKKYVAHLIPEELYIALKNKYLI